MPATEITITELASSYDVNGIVAGMTALDATNGNKFLCRSRLLVLVQNPTGGALTFQMTSQPDVTTGRTGHVNKSLAAGEIRIFQVVADGWADTSHYVQLPSGQSASLKVGIIKG